MKRKLKCSLCGLCGTTDGMEEELYCPSCYSMLCEKCHGKALKQLEDALREMGLEESSNWTDDMGNK